MNKLTNYFPLFLALAIAIGFYLGKKNNSTLFSSNTSSSNSDIASKSKLYTVLDEIKENYVDSISTKELTEKTIEQLLSNLDPHSVYIPYQPFNREEENLKGEFAGVGVKFMILNDTLYVTNVIKNGPSSRAGLKNGDVILKIDTSEVAGVSLKNENVMKLLKGEPSSEVTVKLLRNNTKILDKIIIRGLIPIHSVTSSFMIKEDIGYIRLVRFSETSSREFHYAAQKLLQKGMKKLVFDLRGNGGGYLQIAEEIIDQFLEKNKLMVFTKNRDGVRKEAIASSRGILKNIEVSVLIDSESASASEIVAGAIQDNDRGTIFGRRSFGKGLVQKPIPLPDSSQMRITTARYYTPTGRCIQKPYVKGHKQDYLMEVYKRDRNGELFSLDSSVLVDSLMFTTPKGKKVYGGGGITPDVFIPYDTTGHSLFFRKIAYSRVTSEFSLKYLSSNRKQLQEKSLTHFVRNFEVSDKLFNQFVEFAKTKKITGSKKEIQYSKQKIKERIKEEIASGIWDEEGREFLNARVNNDVKIVLEFFKSTQK